MLTGFIISTGSRRVPAWGCSQANPRMSHLFQRPHPSGSVCKQPPYLYGMPEENAGVLINPLSKNCMGSDSLWKPDSKNALERQKSSDPKLKGHTRARTDRHLWAHPLVLTGVPNLQSGLQHWDSQKPSGRGCGPSPEQRLNRQRNLKKKDI